MYDSSEFTIQKIILSQPKNTNKISTSLKDIAIIVFVILTIIFIFGFILSFYFLNILNKNQDTQIKGQNTLSHVDYQNKVITIEKKHYGFPTYLIIPKINIDAIVESVGITPDGSMQVPNNVINVGWFNLGPRPGEQGNAVIDGHLDSAQGSLGIFANLYKLTKGDKVYIQDSMGNLITFVVRESRTYNPGYAEEVFSSSDSAHLNLITCGGFWDVIKKSYSKRLVVFTDILP